jgi:hypothetical protein
LIEVESTTRHILCLSGGKDSAALAIHLKDTIPDIEYAFMDTDKELPETYEYLSRLEAFLGKPIVRLNDDRGFDHWLEVFGGYLPSAQNRWCTRQLKIKPFERYVGSDRVISYIGLRADEDREGYISGKGRISPRYPFRTDGIVKADVFRIREESGVGVPDYYKWRSRSGCFFCFYQRKSEWIGLLDRHPDLFERAAQYEKTRGEKSYTWCQNESLRQLALRREKIDTRQSQNENVANNTLSSIFGEPDDEDVNPGCFICNL